MAQMDAEPFLVRREDFVNQFRVQFTDEYGRHCDHIFQVGEPVFYSHEGVMGYTTIKDISVSGVFTVYAAPHVMLPTALGQKYVQKLDVDKVWSLLSAGKAPPNEDFLWEKWAHHRWMMQKLCCQSGFCPNHEIRRWKWEALLNEMESFGKSSNGYVLCRPCAEALGLVVDKFAVCPPWRKPTKNDEHRGDEILQSSDACCIRASRRRFQASQKRISWHKESSLLQSSTQPTFESTMRHSK